MLSLIVSVNPSLAFLWGSIAEAFHYARKSELDKTFDSIIKEAEEEIEEEYDKSISVAYLEDKAYWVVNNIFYQADIVDGEIDTESSKPIDPFKMSSRDLMKMLFILDNLTEG